MVYKKQTRRNRNVTYRFFLRQIPSPWRLPALLTVVVLLLLTLWALLPKQAPKPVAGAPEWVEQALLPLNEYSRPGERLEEINGIVIHYTGNPGSTAWQNRSYFASLAQSGETYASSNFIIGLAGETLQTVPSDEVAYASSQRNYDTLSIEVCHPDDTGEFNPKTYASLVTLVQWLVDTYHLNREQILRHYDVTSKECPRWFVQQPDAWAAFLDDIDFSHTPQKAPRSLGSAPSWGNK